MNAHTGELFVVLGIIGLFAIAAVLICLFLHGATKGLPDVEGWDD